MRKLQEHFVHKDGIWLIPFSHLNADSVKVEVWQNDKNIDTKEYTYGYYKPTEGHTIVEDALEYAHEMSKELNLPIIDGSGVEYYTFPEEYGRTDMRTYKSWQPVVNDPDVEEYKYTDQELDDMDERPRKTIKWAILISPGQFDIYDNVTKNPNRFWDTQLYRGMTGYSGPSERIKDLKKFFNKNADKVYKGTWNDIKDGDYTIVVHGRIYESRRIKKWFDNIIKTGIEIDGKRLKGEFFLGTYHKEGPEYGEYDVEDSISFNDKIFKGAAYDRVSNGKEKFENYEIVWDALTCAGISFPEEFTISEDSTEDGREYEEYTVQVDGDHLVYGTTADYNKFKDLEVGDIVSIGRSGSNENPEYYAVIEIDEKKRKAKAILVSKEYRVDDSIWGSWNFDSIISPKKYQMAMKGKYNEEDVITFNLVDQVGRKKGYGSGWGYDTHYKIAWKGDDVKGALRSNMHSFGKAGRASTYNSNLFKDNLPDDAENYLGEPLEQLEDPWGYERRQKAKAFIPAAKDLIEKEMKSINFKKVKEGPDKDGDTEIRFEDSEGSGRYVVAYIASTDTRSQLFLYNEKTKLGGWESSSIKELKKDIDSLIAKL